jgi:hypothetical protein
MSDNKSHGLRPRPDESALLADPTDKHSPHVEDFVSYLPSVRRPCAHTSPVLRNPLQTFRVNHRGICCIQVSSAAPIMHRLHPGQGWQFVPSGATARNPTAHLRSSTGTRTFGEKPKENALCSRKSVRNVQTGSLCMPRLLNPRVAGQTPHKASETW